MLRSIALALTFLLPDRLPSLIVLVGATTDPTFALPRAIVALAVVTSALVLPGSAPACALAFRLRRRLQ